MRSSNLEEIRRLTAQLSRPRKALVVEDEDFLRGEVVNLLRDYGCVVDSTDDGIMGNGLAELNVYDFAIIDLHLPNLHGTEICKTLKANNPKTDIIIMTGQNIVNNLEGFIIVFPKPFDFSLLERQVAGLTGKPYAR